MKKHGQILLFAAFAVLQPLGAATISNGDTLEQVKAALGRPTGEISVRDKQVLFYDRGHVTLVDGKVIGSDLISREEAAKLEEMHERQRKEATRRAEEADRERITRAREVKEERLRNPAFRASSPQTRLYFWQDFQRRYPEVDVSLELSAADAEYRAQLDREAEERRLAELEERVIRAERDARDANRRAYHRYYPYAYQYGYYYGSDFNKYAGYYPANRYYPVRRVSSRRNHSGYNGVNANQCDTPPQKTATPPNPFPTFFAADLVR